MYKLIKLDYLLSDLEPIINYETLNIQYNEIYTSYVNELNNILNSINYDYKYSLAELIINIDEFPLDKRDRILFLGGAIMNHELYFKSMSNLNNNMPNGKIKDAINNQYGSYDNFKKLFLETALQLVGSGYTFLVLNNKKLQIINMTNEENPYSYGFIPIMNIDIWEHAYYLAYKNNKKDYILNFFNIVDFNNINSLYEEKISQ